MEYKIITLTRLKDFLTEAKEFFAEKIHQHTVSEITDFPSSLPANGGNATTATKLATARTIELSNGASGSVSFDGSANVNIPVNKVQESYLSWGGKNFADDFGCIDAAMIPDLGANRLAFGKAEGIIVEYSKDSGATWIDYDASDISKTGLFGVWSTFVIGKADSSNKATGADMLRITIDTDKFGVYTVLNKFAIYLSTNGSTGSYCSIDASREATPDIWVNFANKVTVNGWPGWNIINTDNLITYSNQSSQYGLIRFTFGCTGGNPTYQGLQVNRIMGFGGMGWMTPSSMARYGTIYSYDNAQNVTFPANVKAPTFNGYTINSSVPSNAVFTDTWRPVETTLTNENLNSVITPGFYNAGGSNSVVNKPSGVDHFGLIVIHRANGNYYTQIIFNDSTSWRRYCINSTWGNWAEEKITDTVYTHPTTSGNKHIPSGGSSGQILRWSADGTAVWGSDNDTTYSVATTSTNGLMSKDMVSKLDGIASGATAVSDATVAEWGYKKTDTNTWRGIQNNLTSTSTTDSLAAAQGKILDDKITNLENKIAKVTIVRW